MFIADVLLEYGRVLEESVDYVVNPVPIRLYYSIPYQKKNVLFKTRQFHTELLSHVPVGFN